MRDLYVFVTTDRPDQYLNSIVHCIEQGTKQIIFIQLEDNKTEQVKLNLLRTNVYNLLQNLSTGCYKYYTGDFKDKVVQLDGEYTADDLARLKARYGSCLTDSINWNIERVQYLNLRRYISVIGKNKSAIIDVTSVSKVYIGDIFACSLLENVDKLYTFELLIKPNFDQPWKILIHELADGKEYKYTNLVGTPIFKESNKSILIRTTPLLVSVVGTVLFIAVTLAATFMFGFNSIFIQVMSTVGTVLGIISFFLVYFPIRST
ncbi:hypothetical protein IQ259_20865 [Fortiea sp. LEGE XX443]|uniref:hypothetical protein n=1 Tax=Fortiea sp. LEGE XX443 TaxID=1828611 RepID=UPI001880DACD|nr:hypothetical protein [Fortiea sp. LEGE XX443]MBE9007450.1 hypothetical protein [Fortiea sp. LEGE XX443]